VILDGKSYILRPTFTALNNIEQQLSVGLVALARKLSEGNIMLEELVIIITQCAIDSPQNIRQSLVRGELAHIIEAISRMFAAVFGGCDEST